MAKVKTAKKATAISPYNKFMKTELPKVKADNPNISHREAFKVAAQRWKDAPENPKNKEEEE
ncbi:17731_t:CDS:2 [Funneliformis geosporum]|uniref:8688_t:CDS:1 n=1 Tax=Funneliformis geosporum TaxID=1117311 RepID=A0A9W4SF17_9GLOM|nr:17731_t:CDS:2 [Funneliformis geosporum]CAI2166554.1 8688_t:CDS:2 [Funneliformis geosporum]